MLAAIVRTSLSRPLIIILAAVLLALYGSLSLTRAKFDVFPEFVPAQADIQTEAPGLTAEQVETLVTKPLEDVLNGANGVTHVRSESIQGLSVIKVTFEDGADPFRARQIVSEQLAQAAGRLPAGVAAPAVSPLTSSTMDLLKIGFTSEKLDLVELRDLIEWTVKPRLLAVKGVARANVFGGAPRRIEVRVRTEEMLASNVTLADIYNAVRAATSVRGGGFIDTAAQRILIEPRGQAVSAAALRNAIVAPGVGLPLPLSRVADVVDAPAPQFGDALVMGKRGGILTLSSQYGANTLEVTRAVEAALSDLRPSVEAQGVKIYPALHRPANFIETALGHIELDLLVGTVLILVVLVLFLRSARVALVAFVSIPLSLLAAIIVLESMGQTINTMSLGGLAVALGVVIDDAVVGIENIVRRLRLSWSNATAAEIVLEASVEVRAPIVYATFVLAATIAPILFLSGLQGAFFGPLAFSFLLATLASLLVALTVTPALALLLLKETPLHEEPKVLVSLKNRHEFLLRRLCAKPRYALVALGLASLTTIGGFCLFGQEMLPAFRERHYVLAMNGPPGASFEWMRTIGANVSDDLQKIHGVATVEQQIGRAAAGEDTWPPNRSEFHVELGKISGAQEEEVLTKIRSLLNSYPGVQTEALTFLGDRIGESLSGETAAVAIGVYGPDLDVLDATAAKIAAALKRLPGAADVQVKSPISTPTIRIALDSTSLGLKGLTTTDAYDSVEAAFQGQTVAQVSDGSRIADVAVMTSRLGPAEPETTGQVLVQGQATGAALSDVAEVTSGQGRASILHDGGRRRQVVTVNPTSSDAGSFVTKAKADIAQSVKLPKGVYLEYSGVAEGQKAAAQQVLFNVCVAIVAIIVLLILAFGDGRAATLILSGAPFAMVGGVAAVALTGGVLSLGALVGFVTLFGIAARNAILLVAHTDHLVEVEGAPWTLETVLRATRERVTPILMTALVTGLGLLPLALGAGEAGREVQGPMAIVILGGLITSTIVSLILSPPLIWAYRRTRHAPDRTLSERHA